MRDHAMQEPVYDLSLFEHLNDEYASKPLVATPPKLDPEGRKRRARRKLRQIAADVDLEGKRVVELGCAQGQLTRLLVKRGGARQAIGVDVVASPAWEEMARNRVSFQVADLSSEEAIEAESVDVVVSNSVFEHVRRPLPMLEALARLLRPGGQMWLQFNLHRGPKASHRYREVFFPWPHLLFEPAVCAAFYRKHHGRDQTFAWVNHLTAAEYMEASRGTGLHVVKHGLSTTPIDIDFYRRFEDKLSAFPALDLEADFMLLVLKKRHRKPRATPRLGYLERQRELEAALSAA